MSTRSSSTSPSARTGSSPARRSASTSTTAGPTRPATSSTSTCRTSARSWKAPATRRSCTRSAVRATSSGSRMSSIRRRITVGTLIAVSGFLAINGVTLYLVVRDRLMGERDRGLTILARSTGAAAASELSAGPGAGRDRIAATRSRGSPSAPGSGRGPEPGSDDHRPGDLGQAPAHPGRLEHGPHTTASPAGSRTPAGCSTSSARRRSSEPGSTAMQRRTAISWRPSRLCREGDVDVAVIGSEVLLREDLPVEELMELSIEARRMIPEEIPITTADTRKSFLDHPELLPLIDLVYVNYYPVLGRGFDRRGHPDPRGVARLDARVRPGQARGGVRKPAGRRTVMTSARRSPIRRTRRASSWSSSRGRGSTTCVTRTSLPSMNPGRSATRAPGRPLGLSRSRRRAQAGDAGRVRRHRDGHRRAPDRLHERAAARERGQSGGGGLRDRDPDAPRRGAPRGRRRLVHEAVLPGAHGSNQLHRPLRGRRDHGRGRPRRQRVTPRSSSRRTSSRRPSTARRRSRRRTSCARSRARRSLR